MVHSADVVYDTVREHYAARARQLDSCCGPDDCCAPGSDAGLYDAKLLTELPPDVANFSLGCGDPISLAALQPGETVLDLGSGGGLDCFLAARQVGPAGRVIGVDMTPEMLARARAAAERLGASNVVFRQGYLEALPADDDSVDVVISNCVVNLSPDKPQVFREIHRVLRPGGRLAVSDIVTNGPLPAGVLTSLEAWGACVAGALDARDYASGLAAAGFVDVRIQPKGIADVAFSSLGAGAPFSAAITARKPAGRAWEQGGTGAAASEAIECVAPGGVESRRGDIEALLNRVAEVRPIAGGYEFRLNGDPVETRAVAEAFISAEAACCSFLRFDLTDTPDGLRVRLTGSPAAIQFATTLISPISPFP